MSQSSARGTTKRFCVTFILLWDANNRTCVERAVCNFITITHPPILPIWCRVFWPNTQQLCLIMLYTLITWTWGIFGIFLSWKCSKGTKLQRKHYVDFDGQAECHIKRGVSALSTALTETFGEMVAEKGDCSEGD